MLLGRCYLGLSCPFWCTVLQCDSGCRYTHLKLLHRVVSGARFSHGRVLECDIAHRRSVAVLCMVYKIRCYPMHPLYGALPVPYVPVRALVAHLYNYASSR